MEQTWQIQYQRADGTVFLSHGLPYADKRSAEAIAAIGRVTGPTIGIVSCEVVPTQPNPTIAQEGERMDDALNNALVKASEAIAYLDTIPAPHSILITTAREKLLSAESNIKAEMKAQAETKITA